MLLFQIPTILTAQNRGNALGFQGIENVSMLSAKSAGLGEAYTAMSGDINALFYNPAGLSSIKALQISLNTQGLTQSWRENQEYRPNRRFFTLPFYLERLYIPDPSNNGRWDHEVFFEGLLDTSYVVSRPDTGLDPYSEDAANWKKTLNESGICNLSVALPFSVGTVSLTFAAGIAINSPVYDYDRNETWLDPHIAYIEYDLIPQVDGSDTVRMNWFDFERSRSGSANNFYGALSGNIFPWLSAGFGIEYSTAETDDQLNKNKIGYFDLYYENQFMYSYDTLDIKYEGTSTFNSLKTNLGLLVKKDNISVGFRVNFPYTIQRDFSYEKSETDTLGTTITEVSGTEKVKVPVGFSVGLVLNPAEKFLMTLDWSTMPYSNATWTWEESLEGEQREWANQQLLRFGLEVRPVELLSLRGGYQTISQVFIPDGAARTDKGPEREIWSLGIGVHIGKWGTLDATFLYSNLRYYDQYFSNTNYVTDQSRHWVFGYTYNF